MLLKYISKVVNVICLNFYLKIIIGYRRNRDKYWDLMKMAIGRLFLNKNEYKNISCLSMPSIFSWGYSDRYWDLMKMAIGR